MALNILKLFTVDATGSPPDPTTATTSVVIPYPMDHITGAADSFVEHPDGMGSHFEMFDGTVQFQDFGLVQSMAGGKISINNTQPDMTADQVATIYTMYQAVDTAYYFTDGSDTYKVRFSRVPAGFTFHKQLIVFEAIGYSRYSFTLDFIIEEKLT